MSGIGINKIVSNPVTDKLRSGQPAVGTWLSLCSPVAAEVMAGVGWDWLVVDVEHSPVGFDTMVNCFRAAQLGGAVPMARVPWNDTIWIQRTLDAGALGLVVPMVNTAEDAKRVVGNMKYAIKGQRSFGGSRVSRYIDGDYRTWTEENLAIITMIETAQIVLRSGAAAGKVVVFTGAMKPERFKDSDAIFNVGMAVGATSILTAGSVAIAMGGGVVQADRCTRDLQSGQFLEVAAV